jgi:hypothetical protein
LSICDAHAVADVASCVDLASQSWWHCPSPPLHRLASIAILIVIMADSQTYAGVRNAAAPPDKLKAGSLRACLRCKLLKTIEQFRQDGCDNCGELSGWDTQSYTTPTFKG